jgi:hypothetical protein
MIGELVVSVSGIGTAPPLCRSLVVGPALAAAKRLDLAIGPSLRGARRRSNLAPIARNEDRPGDQE